MKICSKKRKEKRKMADVKNVKARITTDLHVTCDGVTKVFPIKRGETWKLIGENGRYTIEKDGASTVLPEKLVYEFFRV